jgi:hypothetical protein
MPLCKKKEQKFLNIQAFMIRRVWRISTIFPDRKVEKHED